MMNQSIFLVLVAGIFLLGDSNALGQEETSDGKIIFPLSDFGKPSKQGKIFADMRLIRQPDPSFFEEDEMDPNGSYKFAKASKDSPIYTEIAVAYQRSLILTKNLPKLHDPFLSDWIEYSFDEYWIANRAWYCNLKRGRSEAINALGENLVHCLRLAEAGDKVVQYSVIDADAELETHSTELEFSAFTGKVDLSELANVLAVRLEGVTDNIMKLAIVSTSTQPSEITVDKLKSLEPIVEFDVDLAKLPYRVEGSGLKLWFARDPDGGVAYKVIAPFNEWAFIEDDGRSFVKRISFP